MSRSHLSADQIYYNVVIPQNKNAIFGRGNPDRSPQQAFFTETRNSPIVEYPNDYYLSVIRFQAPCYWIPIFFNIGWNPVPGGTVNTTYSSVTLVSGAFSAQSYINHVPAYDYTSVALNQNPLFPQPPASALDINQYNSPYYAVYSYQAFLDMVNSAFALANASIIASAGLPADLAPPILVYNKDTSIISILVDQRYLTLPVNIYMNSLLSNFFNPGFKTFTYGFDLAGGADIQIIIENNNENAYKANPDAVGMVNGSPYTYPKDFYVISQERPTLSNWQAFKSLVFFVGSTPIKNEYVPITTGRATQDQQPILTDFIIPIADTAGAVQTDITYYPTAQYRLVDIFGSSPIYTTSLQVFWTDNYFNLYPLMLPANNQISIKMLFIKKELYKSKQIGNI